MISQQEILNGKIFIIDDKPVNTELLERMLEQAGFNHFRSTNDSRQAVPVYLEFQPDLVLLDLKMPHLDGFQVMEKLRALEEDSYAPILVLTAQPDIKSRMRALKSGAKDFLGKPFDQAEALARINNMLEVRLLNKTLEQKVRERTQELNNTRLEVIRRLGWAAEYRDNETGNHVIRMSKYSALLGQAIGLDDKKCELILNASPMHDIGKIGIPDRILLKPGKLDSAEWEIMKTHVTIGGEILSGDDSTLIVMARIMTMEHHENWDGSGYPKGLKGEEISLQGRIIPVCDVFDALTSERPYKKAWTVEEAMVEIKNLSGAKFEPFLVEKFQHILPEVLKIKASYSDSSNGQNTEHFAENLPA